MKFFITPLKSEPERVHLFENRENLQSICLGKFLEQWKIQIVQIVMLIHVFHICLPSKTKQFNDRSYLGLTIFEDLIEFHSLKSQLKYTNYAL